MTTLSIDQVAQKEHYTILHIEGAPPLIPDAARLLRAEGYQVQETAGPRHSGNHAQDRITLRSRMEEIALASLGHAINLAFYNHADPTHRAAGYSVLSTTANDLQEPLRIAWMATSYPSLRDTLQAGRALKVLDYEQHPTDYPLPILDHCERIMPPLQELATILHILCGDPKANATLDLDDLLKPENSRHLKTSAIERIETLNTLTRNLQRAMPRQLGLYRALNERLGLMYATLTEE